ncbi:MAG: hypothetical protein WD801_11545 [Gemmatimonadaceae bacterium]
MSGRGGDKTLEQRAEELRRIVAQPSEKEVAAAELAAIEQQMSERQEDEARERAKQRLLGIRRAIGSVVASLEEDEARVRAAKAALEDAIRRFNDRFGQVNGLKAEAEALCHRFQLPTPALPKVTAPALRGLETAPSVELVAHVRTRPRVEQCEHGLRERRTYAEVRGTEGHTIITAAGLRPFPELTERQQRGIAHREREQAETNRQHERMAQHVEEAKRALGAFPGAAAGTL